MGAIMCIGVATSNSILMVTFANERLRYEGKDPFGAALAAPTEALHEGMIVSVERATQGPEGEKGS
jgi:hypothetical protein